MPPWRRNWSNVVKHGLGRGLSALIPETKPYFDEMPQGGTVAGARAGLAGPGALVAEIELSRLRPNPGQPRKTFDEAALAELSSSIARHGMLQPILAEEDGEGGYVIVAGERRWRAALQAGLSRVPVIVRRLSLDSRLEVSLIENIQREDLNPLEEARAYQSLMELTSRTQDQIAEAVGKSRSAVANSLRLLTLDKEVQGFVAKGQVSLGHAKVILGLDQKAQQVIAARKVIENGLSVRATEALVQAIREGRDAGSRDATKDASKRQDAAVEQAVRDIEKRVSSLLGTRVQVQHGRRRGKLVIEYHGDDDLERILSAIGVAAK
jgi:ParB family chromosome partitioning protein